MAVDDGWIIFGEFKDGTLFYQCTNCQDALPDSETEIVYWTVQCKHEECIIDAAGTHVVHHRRMAADLSQIETEFLE